MSKRAKAALKRLQDKTARALARYGKAATLIAALALTACSDNKQEQKGSAEIWVDQIEKTRAELAQPAVYVLPEAPAATGNPYEI